jgi:hypothetical protein
LCSNGDGVEYNYTKEDTRKAAHIGGILFYDERREKRERKLIKSVRVFVGHIEPNKCI